MCIIKKYNMDLKRHFVSNHCIATLKKIGLVDMCLISGEGKPTLLGGYVLTPDEAFDLGKGLVNTSALVEGATEEQKKRIVNENIVMAYQLLKSMNDEQAEKLKEIFDIQEVKTPPAKEAHGYIG